MKKAVADTSDQFIVLVSPKTRVMCSVAQLASNSGNKNVQTGIMGVRYSNNYTLQI